MRTIANWRRRTPREDAGSLPGGAAEDFEGMARQVCLRLLTDAPKTRAQLAEALRRRDVPEDVAESVLSRFTDVGLIDDTTFAQAWVRSRHLGRGLARRALAAELRQRGVDKGTVDEAVGELDPDAEEAMARELVRRRLPSTRGLEPAKRMRRLLALLARKGYSPGLAYRVVKDALAEEGADTEELPEAEPDL